MSQIFVVVFEFGKLLAHSVQLPFILLVFAFVLIRGLTRRLRFFHSPFHLLHELGQLPVLFVFDLDSFAQLSLLLAHPRNDLVPLLEFLLNYLKLLRVSKSILRLNDFLQLGAKSHAFVHVQLDLDFCLMRLSVLNITLEQLYLFLALAYLALKLSNLALQVG